MLHDAWGTFSADKQTGTINRVEIVVGGIFDSPYSDAKDGVEKVQYISVEDIKCSRQCGGASGARILVSLAV